MNTVHPEIYNLNVLDTNGYTPQEIRDYILNVRIALDGKDIDYFRSLPSKQLNPNVDKAIKLLTVIRKFSKGIQEKDAYIYIYYKMDRKYGEIWVRPWSLCVSTRLFIPYDEISNYIEKVMDKINREVWCSVDNDVLTHWNFKIVVVNDANEHIYFNDVNDYRIKTITEK